MFKLSERSLGRLNGVRPELNALVLEAIKTSPYDFGISQGVRTKEQQAEIYAQGRTKKGKIVTWTLNSKHLRQSDNFSHAFDFTVWVGGKLTWQEKYYDEVGKHFVKVAKDMGINITWGGNFKRRKDRPHVQWEKS